MQNCFLRNLYSGAFFLLSGFPLFAQKQTGSIKGRVLDAEGNPAVYVTVGLQQIKRITVTNANGFFEFEHLAALRDTLILSSVESQTFSIPVVVHKNTVSDLGEIHLAFKVRELQDVEVKGRISHSYKSDFSFFGNKT